MTKEDFQDPTEEGGNFYSNDKITFRDIVLEHLKRCVKLGSVEWRSGGYEDKATITNGVVNIIKIYISDTREEYIHAVLQLRNLLIPHYDNKITTYDKTYQDEIKTLFDEYEKNKTKSSVNIFRNKQLKLTNELFIELNKLIFRLDYFSVGGYSE